MRHGFYWRSAWEELEGRRIPVIRCFCQGKGPKKGDRTFSLLFDPLHPYVRYSSECCYSILKELQEKSLTRTLNRLAAVHQDLSIGTLYRIQKDFETAHGRQVYGGYLDATIGKWQEELIALVDGSQGNLLALKRQFYDRHQRLVLGLSSQLRYPGRRSA